MYEKLAIHDIKDIDFNFEGILQSERSKITNELIIEILNNKIDNNCDEIKKYLGVD